MKVRQWEVWKTAPPGFSKAHWFIIVTGQERLDSNRVAVNGLACYTLRGHQYTDANGYYHLETIVPGLYPGRTEHIHVKVEAQGGSILTTQLFFPGTSENQSDSIYDKKLLMGMKSTAAGEQGSYNFIIAGSGSSY